jgi:hypothetical protein
LRIAGTVSRFIGAETGVARLVELSIVKVVDMRRALAARACLRQPSR